MDTKKEVVVPGRRLLTGAQVQAKLSCSRPTIWRMIKRGEFPASVRVSPGRVAWDAAAVESWIAARFGAAEQEAA